MSTLKTMTLDHTWERGMGTELILLSVLLDVGVTELYVSHKSVYHNFVIYKQIFNIDDDKLTVFLTENITGFSPNDFFKMYSPYYTVQRPTKSRRLLVLHVILTHLKFSIILIIQQNFRSIKPIQLKKI